MTVLVLDFDGTMTDAEAEGRPFTEGYLEDLCTLVGRPVRDPEILAIADQVDAELAMPGLDRPVLLRRRAYHERLRAVLDEAGAQFTDLVVCGDIFELDLALPLALGARIALVASARTPDYERAFVSAHPRGRVIE